jgi:hypothetical protein
MEEVFHLFPRLKERIDQKGGTLSGGEQQMLAMGRGLMLKPKILLMDEPSMGLAPVLVDAIFDVIVRLNKDGTTILLVEQNALMALAGIILWPAFRPPGTHLAAYAWAAPFLWGFGRDWLIASGRIRGDEGASLAPLPGIAAAIPAALRLAALLAWGLRWLDVTAPAWLLWAQLPAVILLFAGVAVRWVGVYLLMSLGLWQHFAPLDWGQQALMLAYTALIFLGGGRYWTFWQPEERYVHRKRPRR